MGSYKALSLIWNTGMMIQSRADELKTLPVEFLRCWKLEEKLRSNLTELTVAIR